MSVMETNELSRARVDPRTAGGIPISVAALLIGVVGMLLKIAPLPRAVVSYAGRGRPGIQFYECGVS